LTPASLEAPALPAPHRSAALRAGLLAVAALVCLAFLALGTWQVQRRTWKLALIERVEQRVHAPAAPAPGPDRWPDMNTADEEYRHVSLTGTLIDEAETLVQASTELGAGFWVMTPLQLSDGSVVLINRGFVPPERREPSAHRAQTAGRTLTITGLLRRTEPGGGFLRHNDASAGRWYSRDVAAIAAARGLHQAAPYFVDADAVPDPEPQAPVGGLTVIAFHNSHAVYAFTWYTLALMTIFGAWRVLRERRSAPPGNDGALRH
jgi:surfeit locus 1 family protein